MAKPKRETGTLTISLTTEVLKILDQDSTRFGVMKGAYISQLIMQKHMELIATGLLEKMTPEQIQIALKDQKNGGDVD